MDFNKAINHVLAEEGGFTKNPKDSGNWTGGIIAGKGVGLLKGTKYGISAKSYPNLDIERLTRAEAIAIYYRDFWQRIKADQLPDRIRLHVFDFAVNAGVLTAIKMIQGLAGSKKDGIIGPNTLKSAQKLTPWNIAYGRSRHYTGIVRDKPGNVIFMEGWMQRNLTITEICLAA